MKLWRKPDVELHDGLYLKRWHVIPKNRFFNIYLHKFTGPDPGRDLHDHPWINMSVILKGEYVEETMKDVLTRKPGHFVIRLPTTLHRITAHKETTTLFITGPKVREWGFQTRLGWIDWQTYEEYESERLQIERSIFTDS